MDKHLSLGFDLKEHKRRVRFLIYFAIFIPIFICINTLYKAHIVDSSLVATLIVTVFMIEFIIFLEYKFLLTKIEGARINIYKKHFERVNGKYKEDIYYDDITKVEIVKNKDDEVMDFKIHYDRKYIVITGFEEEELLGQMIMENVDGKKIKIKKSFYNKKSTITTIIFIIAASLTFSFIASLYPGIIEKLLPVIIAINFIFFKPMSKISGKRLRVFEVLAGLLLLAMSLF